MGPAFRIAVAVPLTPKRLLVQVDCCCDWDVHPVDGHHDPPLSQVTCIKPPQVPEIPAGPMVVVALVALLVRVIVPLKVTSTSVAVE